ncbi:hypothetical protein D3C87_686470 [compost metagenome]
MSAFDNLKKGDKLLKMVRDAGYYGIGSRKTASPWAVIEWEEVVVEKSSPISFWVNGEKYSKASQGRDWLHKKIFALPVGEDGTPVNMPSKEDVDRVELLFGNVISLISLLPYAGYGQLLDSIPDLEVASALALRALEAERALSKVKQEMNEAAKPS